ncbi:KxYKxGKxW signal peptide domain-containing protein [Fructobacillus ficulneus]|uniref:Extracellular matrix binding protein n=1 Tax=Fructobacillus ficulneus TaxID=157463 RepID=A0A0K8MK89_9LACO|nr:KxYKxGKxW signal peptide domain-containing protein [Fructobacillus ficulneus]GAP00305.1 extracellular matrix binding protein [Fructobacillus ficulneus]
MKNNSQATKTTLNATEHYKMYKSGKIWLFAAVTAFAIAGGGQLAGQTLHTNLGFGEGMTAYAWNNYLYNYDGTNSNSGADTSQDKPAFPTQQALTNWVNAQFDPNNKNYVQQTDQNVADTLAQSGLSQSAYDALTDNAKGVIGKFVDLPADTHLTQGPDNGNFDYQAKRVFVRRDANGNGQILYVPGKTTFYITYHSTNPNSSVTLSYQVNDNEIDKLKVSSGQTASYSPTESDFTAHANQDGSVTLNMRYNASDGNWYAYFPNPISYELQANLDKDVAQASKDQQTLATDRDTKTQAMQATVDKVTSSIDADKTLTAAEKQAEITANNQLVTNAATSLASHDHQDASYNADVQAQQQIIATQAVDKSGLPISTQQANAIADLQKEANAVNAKIDADTGLTTAQKNDQKQKIKDAITKATGVINEADNADDIQGQDTAAAKATLDALYHPSTTTPAQQKANAISAAATAVSNAEATIAADPTLTNQEKADRKAAIDKASQALQNADGTSADDVANKQQTLTDAINAGTTPGKSLDQQRADALAKFESDNNTAQKLADIDADNSLTDAEKTAQKQVINDAINQMQSNLASKTDADDINTAEGDTSLASAVQGAHTAGAETLSARQSAADSQIDADQKEANAKIEADKGLTAQQVSDQEAKVTQDVAKAKQAVANGTAQQIVNTLAAAEGQFNGEYTAANPSFDQQKATADANVEAAIRSQKAALDGDSDLTPAEVADQKAALDKAQANAEDTIAMATNADDLSAKAATATDNINSLNAAKKAAIQKANAAEAAAESTINGLNNLTTDQKNQRIQAVQKARDADIQSIDAATDPASATAAQANGTLAGVAATNTDSSNVPSLAAQQATAVKKLQQALANDQANIQNDPSLSQDGCECDLGSKLPERHQCDCQ